MTINRPLYYDLRAENEIPEWLNFDVVELKYDGIWGRLEIEKGNLQIFSRNDKLKFECSVSYDGRLTLLGEFMYGSNWAETMGLKGQFFAFDLLREGSKDLKAKPLSHRKERIKKVIIDLPEWINATPYYSVNEWKEIWKEIILRLKRRSKV